MTDNSGSGVSLAADYERTQERVLENLSSRNENRPATPPPLPELFKRIGIYPSTDVFGEKPPVTISEMRHAIGESFHEGLPLRQELARWFLAETGIPGDKPIHLVMPITETEAVLLTLTFSKVEYCVKRVPIEELPSRYFVVGAAKPVSPPASVH